MKIIRKFGNKHANILLMTLGVLLVILVCINIQYSGIELFNEKSDLIIRGLNKFFFDKDGELNIPFLALIITTLTLIWNVRSSNRIFVAKQSTSIRKDIIHEIMILSSEMIALSNRSASIFRSLNEKNNILGAELKDEYMDTVGNNRKEIIRALRDQKETYINQIIENSKRTYEISKLISLILTGREEYRTFEKAADGSADYLQKFKMECETLKYVINIEGDNSSISDRINRLADSSENQFNIFIKEAKVFIYNEREKLRKGI